MEQKVKKILSKYDKIMFCQRYLSRVNKTNKSVHDSKFHEYGVTSNFDTCFKNIP